MDEWTGGLYPGPHEAIRRALAATVPGLRDELARMAAVEETGEHVRP